MAESPLSRAADAKRNCDLAGEISILSGTSTDLESQPWYPLQPGDVVLMATADGAFGDTYLADSDEFQKDSPELRLHQVSTMEPAGPENWSVSLRDLWFEAEPKTLVLIRAGRVLYGRPLYEVGIGGEN